MTAYRFVGHDPTVFPTLRNPDDTTVSVNPGDVVELGDQHPDHRWLQPVKPPKAKQPATDPGPDTTEES